MGIRLLNADDVKAVICKYENKIVQKTMIYEIEKLNGVSATEEQMLELLGNNNMKFEEPATKYKHGQTGFTLCIRSQRTESNNYFKNGQSIRHDLRLSNGTNGRIIKE